MQPNLSRNLEISELSWRWRWPPKLWCPPGQDLAGGVFGVDGVALARQASLTLARGSVHLLDGQALSSQEPRESDAIGAGALDTEGDNCAFCADMLAAEAQQSGGGRPRRPPVGGAVAMCGREWLDTAAGITVETNAGSARGHNGSHRVGAVFAPVSAIR